MYEIIRFQSLLFRDFLLYFKYHATLQKKSWQEQQKPAAAFSRESAARIYDLLNDVYEERCKYYNDGGLTDGVRPKHLKTVVQLQHNKPIERKLAKLADYYNDNSIQKAFLAYVDKVLCGKTEPDNLMYYFLSFDETLDSFGVVNYYLNYYAMHYTYKSDF